jgi:plastocyanin
MKRHILPASCLVVVLVASLLFSTDAVAQAGTGSIKGRIRLSGKSPGNAIIRMGVDPMCSKMNAGKRVVQEAVAASADGGLANVFVRLEGFFPQTPVPTQHVVIDQRGCIYSPRVVGARAGQILEVRNSDAIMHNVHSSSSHDNSFNISQPRAGMAYQFKLKDEEIMVRIGCDVHRWMTAYVGVTTNPYFAVSTDGGSFQIDKVPAGTHAIHAWHERYGVLTKNVTVKAGAATTVEFTYTAK